MELLGFRKEPTSTIKQLLTEYDSICCWKNSTKAAIKVPNKKVRRALSIIKKNIDDYYRGRGRTQPRGRSGGSHLHRILDVPQLYMHLESSR